MPARNINAPLVVNSPRGLHMGIVPFEGKFTFPTATVAANSVFTCFRLPRGHRVIGGVVRTDDADSNGTPTITFQIGDAGNTQRYLAVSTLAQTGGATTLTAATGIGFEVLDDTDVLLTFPAAAATQTAGAVLYVCLFVVEI
jgi:type 1 fimbria pilin